MGLFSSFSSNNKKVTEYEYEKKSGNIRSRIMGKLTGSYSEKQKKMAELDSALRPSFEHGGSTHDDGIDAREAKQTFDTLRKNDKHLSLNAHDIEAAQKEIEKGI